MTKKTKSTDQQPEEEEKKEEEEEEEEEPEDKDFIINGLKAKIADLEERLGKYEAKELQDLQDSIISRSDYKREDLDGKCINTLRTISEALGKGKSIQSVKIPNQSKSDLKTEYDPQAPVINWNKNE